jgi:phage FluMu protein Com
MENSNLKEYRCACGKLLFKAAFHDGTVEVKCKSCHNISSFANKIDSSLEVANTDIE